MGSRLSASRIRSDQLRKTAFRRRLMIAPGLKPTSRYGSRWVYAKLSSAMTCEKFGHFATAKPLFAVLKRANEAQKRPDNHG
jgi:hypothetical protein